MKTREERLEDFVRWIVATHPRQLEPGENPCIASGLYYITTKAIEVLQENWVVDDFTPYKKWKYGEATIEVDYNGLFVLKECSVIWDRYKTLEEAKKGHHFWMWHNKNKEMK